MQWKGVSIFDFGRKKNKTEKTAWSKFPKGGKSTTYLPTALHHAGHIRILLNIPRYACIEEMPRFFKNSLKFSRVIPYFQFLEDFNYRVFICIVFCRYSPSNELLNLRALYMYCSTQICFKVILHSSRWQTARNENLWQDMIDCGEKIFQSDLPMSFIINHVKKLFFVDKWVEVKIE